MGSAYCLVRRADAYSSTRNHRIVWTREEDLWYQHDCDSVRAQHMNGVPITDPVVIQPPVPPPIPAAPTGGAPPAAGPVAGNGPDPNAALIQGVLTAIQAMTQMNLEQNTRNASMTQQQSALQAASMRANQLQLRHLTNHLGNLEHEVGRAIASHPTRHSHTIQVTLSPPNIATGQSNDSRTLGSLTRTVPVSLSIPSFNYGPYVQAFQPQPNDKHTQRIDEATHQIVQYSDICQHLSRLVTTLRTVLELFCP